MNNTNNVDTHKHAYTITGPLKLLKVYGHVELQGYYQYKCKECEDIIKVRKEWLNLECREK